MDLISETLAATTGGPAMTKTRTALSFVAALTLALGLLAGCSSSETKSSEKTYCESWQKVSDSFQKLNDIAITTDGVKGLDTAVEAISKSVKELVSSADSMLKPKVEALQNALDSFGDTLSSPQLSVDYLEKLQSGSEDVNNAWNDLVNAAKTSCPDVKAVTV